MSWLSFAQAGEDVLLNRALGHIPDGFWVDVGAGDPEVDSVTAHFSALGWRGINIEPDPDACARLAAARPRDVTLCCAAGAAPGRAVLHRIAGTGLSTLDPAIAARHAEAGLAPEPVEVEVRTLAAICDAHAPPVIHVLKVDAEGHEAEVLAGADFTRHRPWVVVVEATEPNRPTPTHAAWEPGLLAAGYEFVWFDGLNRWYLAAEHADALRGAFATPPNPHDGFVRRAEAAWQHRAEDAEAWGQREAAARAEAEAWGQREAAARAAAEGGRTKADAAAAEAEQAAGALRTRLLAAEAERAAAVRAAAETAAGLAASQAERQAADATATAAKARAEAAAAISGGLAQRLAAAEAALREAETRLANLSRRLSEASSATAARAAEAEAAGRALADAQHRIAALEAQAAGPSPTPPGPPAPSPRRRRWPMPHTGTSRRWPRAPARNGSAPRPGARAWRRCWPAVPGVRRGRCG